MSHKGRETNIKRKVWVRVCLMCIRHSRWALNTPDFEGAGGLSRWSHQSKQRGKNLLLEEQLTTLLLNGAGKFWLLRKLEVLL